MHSLNLKPYTHVIHGFVIVVHINETVGDKVLLLEPGEKWGSVDAAFPAQRILIAPNHPSALLAISVMNSDHYLGMQMHDAELNRFKDRLEKAWGFRARTEVPTAADDSPCLTSTSS